MIMNPEYLEAMFDDPDRIPIGEAAQSFFKIAQEVQKSKRKKILTKNGKAYVAISPLMDVALADIAKRKRIVEKHQNMKSARTKHEY